MGSQGCEKCKAEQIGLYKYCVAGQHDGAGSDVSRTNLDVNIKFLPAEDLDLPPPAHHVRTTESERPSRRSHLHTWDVSGSEASDAVHLNDERVKHKLRTLERLRRGVSYLAILMFAVVLALIGLIIWYAVGNLRGKPL